MEYTLHSVRKLMIFLPLFKDIITHKLYSRTFSEFFTGSAKLVFSRKKKVKIVHCAFPWQNCVKFPSFYTLSKRMRVALYFLSSLSLLRLCSNNKEKNMTWNLKLYTHTHTPDPIGKLFWILFLYRAHNKYMFSNYAEFTCP